MFFSIERRLLTKSPTFAKSATRKVPAFLRRYYLGETSGQDMGYYPFVRKELTSQRAAKQDYSLGLSVRTPKINFVYRFGIL